MRELIARERGVAVIEFALIAPLLILLTVGILDVARGINALVVVGHASEEAAHYAILNPAATIPAGQTVPPAIASAARARTSPLDPSAIAVTAEYYDRAAATFRPWPSTGIPVSSPATTGVLVRISVSYPWTAISAIAGSLLSTGSGTLTSSSLMETRR